MILPMLITPKHHSRYRWIIEGPWKLLISYDGKLGRYEVIHKSDPTEPKLYNLIDDPDETNNLAKVHPKIVGRLAKKIQNWHPLSKNAPKMLSELP